MILQGKIWWFPVFLRGFPREVPMQQKISCMHPFADNKFGKKQKIGYCIFTAGFV